MTEPTEQKRVRFLVFAPEGAKIYGLDEAVRVLENHAWAEVTRATDPQTVCNELFARKVDGLVLLRPKEEGVPAIEQILLQWHSANPEEVPVLLTVDWPTNREAHFWRALAKNVLLYCGFCDMKSSFFLFGELVRSENQ